MTENNWLKKELRRIELVRKGMHDQYNSDDNPLDMNDVEKTLKINLQFAPHQGQTWQSYITELSIYKKYCEDKNIRTHVNGPKGAWYTHRNPAGCFACEDLNLINVMFKVLASMSEQYPDNKF